MTNVEAMNTNYHNWKDFILQSKYIDAKDETDKWLLAIIDEVKDNDSVVQVYFDGWFETKYKRVGLDLSVELADR
jgi:hypothetical protein